MSAATEARLRMRGVVKRFGGVVALDGAELEARAGEILGLCGENGAGKSTLLKILAGVHVHGSYEGELVLDGARLELRSTAAARAAGIAIVHQELMLVPEMTVAENLMLGREPRRFGFVDGAALEAAARTLLQRFGEDAIDVRAKVGTLGIGVQQVVEIVRALGDDAKVLVLDEPTAALSVTQGVEVLNLVERVRERGVAVVLVSHHIADVLSVADRVVVLRLGRNAGEFRASETTSEAIIAAIMGAAPTEPAPPRPPARVAPLRRVEGTR